MRECPNCHYVDPPYWRNRLFDYEVDICKLEDVFTMDFNLYLKLVTEKRGSTITQAPYCYRLTRTGWVYRIWESLFKVRGWSPQKYYDGSGSRASALRKVNLQAFNHRQLFVKAVGQSKESGKFLDKIRELENKMKELGYDRSS